MSATNKMSRLLGKLDSLPEAVRQRLQTLVLGHAVPFVGTAGLLIEEVSATQVTVRVRNRRRVQNHIKGVHAAAMALLAETATGFALAMHLPDDRLPLLKAMKIDYLKRARGDLRAVAALSSEHVSAITKLERGEIQVPVTVTDQDNETPVRCEMMWAWIPKQRSRDL